jgi:hypothetical protein
LVFDLNLRNDKGDEDFIMRSRPIYDLKKIKKVMQIVQWNNRVMGQMTAKSVEVEKHNFSKWEDLDIDWKK